ncbi:MAG: FAD-dependent oxidoreductase [Gemmatimonadota bacterium]
MSTPDATPKTVNGRCWEAPGRPAAELLKALKAGPLALGQGAGPRAVEDHLNHLRREQLTGPVVFVGAGTCGLGAGADRTLAAVRSYLEQRRLEAEVVEVGCIGLCSEEPILDVQLPGRARVSFGNVVADRVDGLLDQVLGRTIPAALVLGQFRDEGVEPWPEVPYLDELPFFRSQRRWVLANCGIVDPDNLDEYIARGGFGALLEILTRHSPEQACDLVEKSGLRGRGGAGFPTGRKWHLARKATGDTKYLICNADEGDPGAFMDRAVCESDPFRLLEGMAIAAYAIGASKAIIYIRAEYPLAVRRLDAAIDRARAYGLLGPAILGRDFGLEISIKMGAGAFVCGEETALIHSIEGRRGMPRPRPPYPVASGLFGKPTVINNVETLANLPGLVAMGWERFAAMGTATSKGTKVFALSGMVRRTGLAEVPMGIPIRQIVFSIGGGIQSGRRCKAVQIGGPSGGCIPEAHLDLECDYEALKGFGAIMGSGGFVVLDEGTCMVDLAKYFMQFIQNESCGKCIPCREGTRRMLETLEAITRPRRAESRTDALERFQGVVQLRKLAEVIKSTSLCGLGQTAPNPVLSTMRWFPEEYQAHIFDRCCPSGSCVELAGAACQNGCPLGTEVWRYVAHVGRGEYDEAYRVIRAANPLPSVCARVCDHPCERACRAGATGGEAIAIRALKRFAVDRADPTAYRTAVRPATNGAARVAVIGGGPAGLTAAHYLSLQGHRVTLLEGERCLGGMLVSAIPEYRLPRGVLRREIQALLNDNVQVRCGARVGRDFTIDGLFGEGYAAVYVATGAHASQGLGLAGEDAGGVHQGLAFLKAYNLEGRELARGKVGVIGGGNSAMDAARVALRQSGVKEVTVYYRRTRAEMPAFAEEVEACLEEGIRLETLVSPVAILSEDGQLRGLRLIHNRLGEPDASGRQRPVPIPGSEEAVALDTLITAVGEHPDLAVLDGVRTDKGGTVAADPETAVAGRPGLFAGGDLTTGPNTVVEAIAAGKRAAATIARYLEGRQLRSLSRPPLPLVYVEPLVPLGAEDEVASRAEPPHLPPEARRWSFSEVELCYREDDALREARRCLRCDLQFTQPS